MPAVGFILQPPVIVALSATILDKVGLSYKDGDIALSALPKDTISKFSGFAFILFLLC